MIKGIIVLIMMFFLFGCKGSNNGHEKNKLNVENVELGIDSITTAINNSVIIDSLKQTKIDWNNVRINKLPIGSKAINKNLVLLEKYCCSPKCDKDFKLNSLDIMFSKKTEYKTKSNHYDHGHPSGKQGYFGLRLPDIGSNKVLLYSYFDSNASDYKSCTIELQTVNSNNELIDKKIIQDGLHYECGWTRSFSILKDYTLKIKDYSYCVDIVEENGRTSDEIQVDYLCKIESTGKITVISEKILEPEKIKNK